jgi:hypothetical protein
MQVLNLWMPTAPSRKPESAKTQDEVRGGFSAPRRVGDTYSSSHHADIRNATNHLRKRLMIITYSIHLPSWDFDSQFQSGPGIK